MLRLVKPVDLKAGDVIELPDGREVLLDDVHPIMGGKYVVVDFRIDGLPNSVKLTYAQLVPIKEDTP